jgi:hypothetical protein
LLQLRRRVGTPQQGVQAFLRSLNPPLKYISLLGHSASSVGHIRQPHAHLAIPGTGHSRPGLDRYQI